MQTPTSPPAPSFAPIRKIAVFGAGAIGGHIAARLAHAGRDVSIVARGENLVAIQSRGLRFISAQEDFTVQVPACADGRELGQQDLVIVTTKAHSLPHAVDGLLPLLRESTPIVFAMNGIPWWYFHGLPEAPERATPLAALLDPQGRLAREIGVHRAVGCIVRSPNDVNTPGIVRNHRTVNRFHLGEPDDTDSHRLQAIHEALKPGLPGLEKIFDVRRDVWDKVLLNMANSVVSVLTRLPPSQAGDHPEVRAVYEKIMGEGAAVAHAYGVPVKVDPLATLNFVRSSPHAPSMLQDLLAGRSLEVDAQLRAVQQMARPVGVPTPNLDLVLGILRVLCP